MLKDTGGSIGRVIVIVTRQIGDVLLTTPLIEAAKERWPQAQIDVLGFAGTLGMLRGNPAVHELIEVPSGSGWRQVRALLSRLWRRYDLALVAEASDRAHFYGWAAARRRSGLVPERRSISWWKKLLSTHTVTVDDDRTPTVLEKLALLTPWRAQPASVAVVPPAPHELPDDLLRQLRERFVVVHVPSMWRYKQWPIKYFAEVIQALLALGHQLVLTGTASEVDQAQVAAVRHLGSPPDLIDVSGKLNLSQVTALLHRAALYVGPDTSITHLAAATGTPLVTMFGPTNPVRWGPWPQNEPAASPWQRKEPRQAARKVILLQAAQECVACGHAGCEDHRDSRSECLEALPPQRVIDECLQVLGQHVGP